MTEQATHGVTVLMAVSNAMVKLHKEQFGRGPTQARSNFAGADSLLCVLEEVLLPAELKLIELGEIARVRDSRVAFQAATSNDFVAAVEEIVGRKVRAFASGVDAENNVVFENFVFESQSANGTTDGHTPS